MGGSAPTRGPAPVCLCWTCEPSEPSARPASAVRGLRALRPGRGLAGPGVTGHAALAPRPQPPAPQPSVTRGWGVGGGQASCLGVPWGAAPSCPRAGISSRPLPLPLDLFLPKALVIPASWLACPHGCPPADGVRVSPPHPGIPQAVGRGSLGHGEQTGRYAKATGRRLGFVGCAGAPRRAGWGAAGPGAAENGGQGLRRGSKHRVQDVVSHVLSGLALVAAGRTAHWASRRRRGGPRAPWSVGSPSAWLLPRSPSTHLPSPSPPPVLNLLPSPACSLCPVPGAPSPGRAPSASPDSPALHPSPVPGLSFLRAWPQHRNTVPYLNEQQTFVD